MKAFWDRLSQRERLFVLFGGALVAILVLLQLIVAPAIGWRRSMAEKREGAEDLYKLVASASATSGGVATNAASDRSTPIINVVTDTAAASGVEISFRNARPDGGVDANITSDPEKLFDWLSTLESSFGVSVTAADIAREKDGSVRAQLTLARRNPA
ncbi:MAG: type II secretion system protein GspM [Parvularculaceae bacterium]|nr:type II secretion system protein GspM [Parvularculaceae bacterium]